jgi:hypothetical protein
VGIFDKEKKPGCQKTDFIRGKGAIIRPFERKFSKQMEISNRREESNREGNELGR